MHIYRQSQIYRWMKYTKYVYVIFAERQSLLDLNMQKMAEMQEI